jgi:hypothetical protein
MTPSVGSFYDTAAAEQFIEADKLRVQGTRQSIVLL